MAALPLDTRELLRARRATMSDKDALLGLVYEGALDATAAILGAERMPELRAKCAVPKKLVSFFRYPAAPLLDLALAGADALGLADIDELLSKIGEGAVASFFQTPVGKTMMAINGGSVHRMLIAAPAAYAAVFSFGQRRHEKRGEQLAAMHFAGDFVGPAMQAGILMRGIEISCGVRPKVQLESKSPDGRDFVHAMSW